MLRRALLSLSLAFASPRGAIFATQFIEKKGTTAEVGFSPSAAGLNSVGNQTYVNHNGTVLGMIQAAVAGLGKIVGGEVTLDGGNPTPVVTGLTTILAAMVIQKSTAAPGDDPSAFTIDYSAGTLNIYAWKNTGGTDPTLVASTNNAAVVTWIAIGI